MYRIEVALPVPLARNFSYLSDSLIPPGSRVRVPFGNRKLIGMVLGDVSGKSLEGIELKHIDQILDSDPILSPTLLKLGFWISEYYLHPLGEVFKAMLPTSEKKKVKESYHLKVLSTETDYSEFLSYLFKNKQAVSSPIFKKRFKEWLQTHPEDKDLVKKLTKKALIQRSKESELNVKKITHQEFKEHPVSGYFAPLSSEQENVVQGIVETMGKPRTFLIRGVTGSGKTRVYLSVMKRYFETYGKDAQALLLVPEIALTPQMTHIFEESFPGSVAVVHSALSDSQRWNELSKIREGSARVLIGPRSAVFARFKELRLVIVDEEHDQSYKQASGLTYNGRDIAVVRSHMESITCILGSATPSVESYWNAKQGKYHLLELRNRVVDLSLPSISIVPSLQKVQTELVTVNSEINKESFLSPLTLQALKDNFEKGQQAIVLVNRRGYAYYLVNHETKAAIECPECSISLTVHKNRSQLLCHYCGYQSSLSELLEKFPKTHFSAVGVGSQKAEALLKQALPQATIGRLDSDILTSREKLFPLLNAFRKGEIQILVGTQILAKGHDFPNVGLTVICELDAMLDLPDFRAGERSFQLIVQAAGRAGRCSRGGRVLIQSLRENDPVLKHAIHHDYEGFMKEELELRKKYAYPPFTHLIRIELTSEHSEKLEEACSEMRSWQQNLFLKDPAIFHELRIIGPVVPPIERIKRRFRRSLLFSSKSSQAVHRVAYDFLSAFPLRRGDLRIQVDVDPQSLI